MSDEAKEDGYQGLRGVGGRKGERGGRKGEGHPRRGKERGAPGGGGGEYLLTYCFLFCFLFGGGGRGGD